MPPTLDASDDAYQVVFYTDRNGSDDIYLMTLNGEVRALAVWNETLIVGGDFSPGLGTASPSRLEYPLKRAIRWKSSPRLI